MSSWTYRDHYHLGMHIPLRVICGAIEEPFQQVEHSKNGGYLHYGPAIRYGGQALCETLVEDSNGHGEWLLVSFGRGSMFGTKCHTAKESRSVMTCDRALPELIHVCQQHHTMTIFF